MLQRPHSRRTSPRSSALAVLLVLTAVVGACFSEAGSPAAPEGAACDIPVESPVFGGTEQVLVAIRDFAFNQPTVTVSPGTTVTWVNCDEIAHTSTSDEGGTWDSGLLELGETFSHTFTDPGEFPYRCTPHPSMQAVVIVAES